jgi:hypothetical protein
VAWGLIALLALTSSPEKANALSDENTVLAQLTAPDGLFALQHSVLDSRPGRCPDTCLGSLDPRYARPDLLESPFVLLERLRDAQNPAPTLEYNGEDDPKKPEPKKPEDPKKPSPPPAGGTTPRTLDVPRRLTEIRRDLRIGQLWVAETAERPIAVRVSLEVKERVIGAITLDPESGQPVIYQERANYRPTSTPENTQLTSMLQGVRAQSPEIKFGTFVLPSPRGLEIQVYLSAKLVSYVYLDPKNGDAVNDDGTVREIGSSSIRLR